MATQEIVIPKRDAIARKPQAEEGLMSSIVKLASNPNVDIDKLQKLLNMQQQWEIQQDKKAMRHGMAEFKKNPPAIIKKRLATVQTKTGGTYSYSFADLENITTEAQKGLAEYGITHGFAIVETPNLITVTCILKYGAYEEPGVPLTGGLDNSGNKTDIQAKASTVSFLEKYTFLAAVGMAAGMPDTDGATTSSRPRPTMPPEDLVDALNNIAAAPHVTELKRIYESNYKAARDIKDEHGKVCSDKEAMKQIIAAYERRKAELA